MVELEPYDGKIQPTDGSIILEEVTNLKRTGKDSSQKGIFVKIGKLSRKTTFLP